MLTTVSRTRMMTAAMTAAVVTVARANAAPPPVAAIIHINTIVAMPAVVASATLAY